MTEAKTTLFSVSNHHVPDCGTPQHFDGDDRQKYIGYFANEHGEQVVFVYDWNTRTGTVWMGDAGWKRPYKVVDGTAPGLIMGECEALWLRACWLAVTAFDSVRDVKKRA